MKKGFTRPSQQMKEMAATPEATPEIGITNVVIESQGDQQPTGNFVKYDEVMTENVNMFKGQIVVKPSSEWLNKNKVEHNNAKRFNLNWIKSLSCKFSIYDIEKALNKFILNDINNSIGTINAGLDTSDIKVDDNGYASDLLNCIKYSPKLHDIPDDMDETPVTSNGFSRKEIAAMVESKTSCYTGLRLTKGKDKEKQLILILNKNAVIRDEAKGDKEFFDILNKDAREILNHDAILPEILAMAEGDGEIKAYGDDLVLVLDPFKVIVQLILPSIVKGVELKDVKDFIKMSQPVITGININFLLAIDITFDSNAYIYLPENTFTCCRLQVPHEEFLLKANEAIKQMSIDSSLVYVKTNSLALQPSGVEALKAQLAGATNLSTVMSVPLIKINRSKFAVNKSYGVNTLLDMIYKNSSDSRDLDPKLVLDTFGTILDGKVYPFDISEQYKYNVAILPNYKKLALFIISANTRATNDSAIIAHLTENNIMKCDIADDGRSVAIHLSI